MLDKVNSLRAHSMGFHLEAVGWERVVPSFGRPQALINEKLMSADPTIIRKTCEFVTLRVGQQFAIDADQHCAFWAHRARFDQVPARTEDPKRLIDLQD